MSEPDDDSLYDLEEAGAKSDWRRGGQGIWTVTLPNGNTGQAVCTDDSWQATVTINGKVNRSRAFKSFDKCVAWADRLLYPPRTAWDRIKSV